MVKMNHPNVLEATKPLLYETGVEEYPYQYAGTCFPLRCYGELYILSAKHCYTNHQLKPECTLFPVSTDPRSFYAFDRIYQGSIPGASDDQHSDFIALRVAKNKHSKEELLTQVALDLSTDNTVSLATNKRLIDVWVRGYPFENPKYGVDYDAHAIRSQAYTTNNGGLDVTRSPFDRCYWLNLKAPVPPNVSPNGMSGSPVYGIHFSGRILFLGIITCFDRASSNYLLVGSEVVANLLRKCPREDV
jgi:hypothetical protein